MLAFAEVMMDHKHNPAQRLWVQCVDVDRLAVMMCYLQLSLWHIPAEVIVGNPLTLEVQEVFHTPAHHLYGWEHRLNLERAKRLIKQEPIQLKSSELIEVSQPSQPVNGLLKNGQFDFNF